MTLAWRAETRVGNDATQRPSRPVYVPLCVPDITARFHELAWHVRASPFASWTQNDTKPVTVYVAQTSA
jgi:hypothetical protein